MATAAWAWTVEAITASSVRSRSALATAAADASRITVRIVPSTGFTRPRPYAALVP